VTTDLVPAHPFSEAKTGLSELMSEVVRKHRPHLIERNHGRETMALIGAEELDTVLRPYSLVPDVVYGRGEVTMSLAPLGLVASGASLDAAADAMLDELRQYAREFIDRYEYFRHTDRTGDLPWVLRFSLTPPGAQRDLLFEEPTIALAPRQERVSAPR
jgi:hypothetical protein